MRTHSLANGFGIQIEDVDLAAALDDETFNAIRTCLLYTSDAADE